VVSGSVEIVWRIDGDTNRPNLNHLHRNPEFDEAKNLDVFQLFEWSLDRLAGESAKGALTKGIETDLSEGAMKSELLGGRNCGSTHVEKSTARIHHCFWHSGAAKV